MSVLDDQTKNWLLNAVWAAEQWGAPC